jgi:RNA polymerase sigma-70 factor (ECF subfamily)
MTNRADRLYERVLVLRCQAGDEAAFVELVGEYSPRLRYYLRKMLTEGDHAEDALQDVWLQVFRGLPKLADPGAFPAWVYRIARDRAYREWRKRRPAARSLEETDVPEEPNSSGGLSAEDAEFIHAALDGLAPEHREVLVLCFLEDMSYEDIAQAIGCPLGTVRSRIHYAKRALRCALEKKSGHG